jgi:uncharacterized protein DUF1353
VTPRPPRFLDPLSVRLYGRNRWITERRFRLESEAAQRIIEVPAEFVTDFASVPRLPLAYLIAGNRCPQAALPHDFLYQHPDFDDRALGDAVFLEAAGITQPELGIEAEDPTVRRMMYAGIRAGGWWAWQSHGKRAAALNPIWTASRWPEVQAA